MDFIFTWQFYAVWLAFAVLYGIVLKPLIPMLAFKMKHGRKVKILYFPLIGHHYWTKINQVKHGHPFAYVDKLSKENPELIAIITNMGIRPHILFCQPSYIKQILQDHQFFRREEIFPIENLMSQGMAFSTGDTWKTQRKNLSHSFTYEQLMLRIATIRDTTTRELDSASKNVDIDALQLTTKITGEVIIRTFFGQSFGESIINGRNAALEIQYTIGNSFDLLQQPFFGLKYSLLRMKAIKYFQSKDEKDLLNRIQGIREKANQVIDDRITQYKASEGKQATQDFLDVYLQQITDQNKNVQKEEMIQQFITFFFAGTDTTAHLSLMMLYNLATYPVIQEELRKEIDELYHGDGDKLNENLKKMLKMQAFINECLRITVFGEMLIPRVNLQDSQINDFTIPKGFYVNICPRFIYTNERNFNDPKKFSVERWLNDADKKLNDDPMKFIPFSAFGRNCIGQHLAQIEAKIIICETLKAYKVVPSDQKVQFLHKLITEFIDNKVIKLVPL